MIGIAKVTSQLSPQESGPVTGASFAADRKDRQVFGANLLAYAANAAIGPSTQSSQESASAVTQRVKQQAKTVGSNSQIEPLISASQSGAVLSNPLSEVEAIVSPKQVVDEGLSSDTSVIANRKTCAVQTPFAPNASHTPNVLAKAHTGTKSAPRNAVVRQGTAAALVTFANPPIVYSQPDQSGAQPVDRSGAPSSSKMQHVTSLSVVTPHGIPPTDAAAEVVAASTSVTSTIVSSAKGDKPSPMSDSATTRKQTKFAGVNATVTQSQSELLLPVVTALVVPVAQLVTLHHPSTTNTFASSTESLGQSVTASVPSAAATASQAFSASVPQIQCASGGLQSNSNSTSNSKTDTTNIADPNALTTAYARDTHNAPSLTDHSSSSVLSSASSTTTTSEASSSSQGAAAASGWTASSVSAAVSGLHLGGVAPAINGPMQQQAPFVTHAVTASQAGVSSSHGGAGVAAGAHSAGEPYFAQQTTLHATPNSLEVGLSGGSQGWLKVRAEVKGDNVSATLSSTSTTGTKLLHEQLPALNAFLSTQNLSVAATVTPKLVVNNEQHASMANLSHEGGQQRNSSQSQPQRQFTDAPESGGTSVPLGAFDSRAGTVPLLQPALLAGSGSWLNVLA